jgi:phosphoglycerate dehydrogenase-like enzyme
VARDGTDEPDALPMTAVAPKALLEHIAVLDDFQEGAHRSADWTGLPVEVFHDHLSDENSLAQRLAPFDAVVLIRERTALPRTLLERLPRLRLVVTTGMHNRTIDRVACAERGVAVCGTHSEASPTVELTWALILALARRVPLEDQALRRGRWQTSLGLGLEGATLGVLGLGRIGTRVAALGRAFGMRVIAWSPNLTMERAAAEGAQRVEKDELFAAADIVTLHVASGRRSQGVVGARELRLMKPDALLVNTARATLVDQEALIAALKEGRLGGAAIDVFDQEPMPITHPLFTAPNTILTPHLGYVTAQNYRIYFEQATECLRAWNAGAPLPRRLDMDSPR